MSIERKFELRRNFEGIYSKKKTFEGTFKLNLIKRENILLNTFKTKVKNLFLFFFEK